MWSKWAYAALGSCSFAHVILVQVNVTAWGWQTFCANGSNKLLYVCHRTDSWAHKQNLNSISRHCHCKSACARLWKEAKECGLDSSRPSPLPDIRHLVDPSAAGRGSTLACFTSSHSASSGPTSGLSRKMYGGSASPGNSPGQIGRALPAQRGLTVNVTAARSFAETRLGSANAMA